MKAKHEKMGLAVLESEAPAGSFGALMSETEPSKGVIELRFESVMTGYSGWNWLVTLTQLDKRKPPTVSEINLVAGEGALLAPAWVPWSERLAEFRTQLKAEGKAKTDAEADELIKALVVTDDIQSKDSEADSDQRSVQPPLKARVRKRRVKHSEPDEDQEPN
ncbi:MAG: DUF3027 domain-containing protein [Aquiluna sp.]|nr:DUF3027 domain-containing protein [Aquiluna sp.]